MINNKSGSSIVLLSMVFVSIMVCITLAITISRSLVVKSECESFGHVWTKAVLSEYDKNLLNEYNIMAYWGNEAEVQKKVNAYINYSSANKMDARIGSTSAELTGYELSDPVNFREAIKLGSVGLPVNNRTARVNLGSDDYENREIKNHIVIDTLPSCRTSDNISVDSIVDYIKKTGESDTNDLFSRVECPELIIVKNCMSNHITKTEKTPGFFINEWEYVINGSMNDEKNYSSCKRKLTMLRNALNLAYLYSDKEKMEVITLAAELLTPGAVGAITQALIAETWAAVETDHDLSVLENNGKVPFIKTSRSWHTDLGNVLDNSEIKDKLNEEGIQLLNEKRETITGTKGAMGNKNSNENGQTYDDYLAVIMMTINSNVRLLRIMDIVQINMKYWYYRDFNMEEYYTGVRFSINANGKSYDFEDNYK